MSDLETVVSGVAASKKYRSVCIDAIRRIAAQELAAHGSVKAATKATKRKLHQAYGAFEGDLHYEVAYRRLEAAYGQGSDSEIEAACRHVLELHSSTRERLSILDRFYRAVFEITGRPESVLDLGCGLNPLALPWMDLSVGSDRGPGSRLRYIALDIDADRVDFLNRYLALAGLAPLARCQDLLCQPPDDDVDVALLLKMSPTLERQEPGSTLRLVEYLRAPSVVVSFAIRSLGGRDKGMEAHYQRQFLASIEDRPWSVKRLAFDTELVFVVSRP
jgi:16S rRNA (guanine(1405)-N(7))-methyltransferase